MTIATGFIYHDGIILASDSQMTYGDRFKRYDGKKVFWLNFAGSHNEVAVCFAGCADGARMFQDILEDKAAQTELHSPRRIVNIVREALKETHQHTRAFLDDDPAIRKQQLQQTKFRALIGYHWRGKPTLLLANSGNGYVRKVDSDFEVIGCGSQLAQFLLFGGYTRKLSLPESLSLAIHVIRTCKEFDPHCGGPFQYVVLNRGGYGGEISKGMLQAYEGAAGRVNTKLRKALARQIAVEAAAVLERTNERWIARQKAT